MLTRRPLPFSAQQPVAKPKPGNCFEPPAPPAPPAPLISAIFSTTKVAGFRSTNPSISPPQNPAALPTAKVSYSPSTKLTDPPTPLLDAAAPPTHSTESLAITELENLKQDIFEGKNHRRQSFEGKEFAPFYLDFFTNPQAVQFFANYPTEQICFADRTSRLAQRNHIEDASFILTSHYLFLLDSHYERILSDGPILISSIEAISLSKERDNVFCLHLSNFQTEILMSSTKAEIVTRIVKQYLADTGKILPTNFTNEISFSIAKDVQYHCVFERVEDSVRTIPFCTNPHS